MRVHYYGKKSTCKIDDYEKKTQREKVFFLLEGAGAYDNTL